MELCVTVLFVLRAKHISSRAEMRDLGLIFFSRLYSKIETELIKDEVVK